MYDLQTNKIAPILTLLFILICPTAQALDEVSMTLANITAKAWQIEGAAITLTNINKTPQQLLLTINKFQLPAPFSELSLLDIRCTAFTWQADELRCQQGQVSLHLPQWQTRTAQLSFVIQKNHSLFKLTDAHWLGGIASIDGEAQGDNWSMTMTMKAANGKALLALLPATLFKLSNGDVDFQLQVSGNETGIKTARLNMDVKQLTGQTDTGRFATEKLSVHTQINAQNTGDNWQWQSQSQLNTGALYAEPVYLKPEGHAMTLTAEGSLNTATSELDIQAINFQHLPTGSLNGNARLTYNKQLSLEHAQFTLRSDDLQTLTVVYLKPFFAQSFLDSLAFAGHLDAKFTLTAGALTALSASVNQLAITDSVKRIKLQNGLGTINWSANETFNQPSQFAWQQLQLYELPIGATQLKFVTNAGNVQLLGNANLPFLGGDIHIQQFKLQTNAKDAEKVVFQGEVNQVSLQQLSAALKWQPLIGTLSGSIPQVNYRDKKLTLDGELLIKVFNGTVKVAKLAAANLFNALPSFYADIDIDQLDLEQLTSKYEFGNITGKLSGFVNQLHIENGQPIGFLAWLGTPDNDDTPHRISQKAVNNIAHIGGSGASDLVSRSFLKLFDTFGYDKIGLGCYLHEGVCQLSGVKATDLGYTIVLGGGVPRIDVIGYNTRVDWTVLMERLARISTSDKVIVQ
jgi:hypothetical protein